jgi:hypothetical protein
MIAYYQQWPSAPVYARDPKTGAMQCPPGTAEMPLYNRPDSPVRCVTSDSMKFAQWVTSKTERVPTTDVGPVPIYKDKYNGDLHGFGAVERGWKDYAFLAATTVGIIAGVYWLTERMR